MPDGDSSRQGWTTEADNLGGQRADAQVLARDLAFVGLEKPLSASRAP